VAESNDQIFDIAVVGGGAAGMMAFLRGVLNTNSSVLFAGDAGTLRRARSTWCPEIAEVAASHGLPSPIELTSGSALQWISEQRELHDLATTIASRVTRLERGPDGFTLQYSAGRGNESLRARHVVVATGAIEVYPRINGSRQALLPFADRGEVLFCANCDGHLAVDHRLSVIGRDDHAMSVVALMIERYRLADVVLLTHGVEPKFSPEFSVLAEAYGVQPKTARIVEVLGDPDGDGLQGFRLEDGSKVVTDRVILALGRVVFNQLVTAVGGQVDEDGRVIVSDRFETSVPGLFAVGDVVADARVELYSAWDQGLEAADEINRRLSEVGRSLRAAGH
jgi:thioredoxin reductase (NADPH)